MSSFTYDTMALIEESDFLRAGAYVALTVGLCFAGVAVGRAVGLGVWGAR
jgi:fluoride ion exporter CrcB/FEX